MRMTSDSRASSARSAQRAPPAATAGRLPASMSWARTVTPLRTRCPMSAAPIRPAPMTPTVGSAPRGDRGSAPPDPLGREDNALLGVHANEDGAADRRAQRRMLARQQRARADGDAEADRLAEKHLLLDRPPPDIFTGQRALRQLDVLGTDRDRHTIVGLHGFRQLHRE